MAWWRLEVLIVISSYDHVVDLRGVVSFVCNKRQR
jgi:hypothetical protein